MKKHNEGYTLVLVLVALVVLCMLSVTILSGALVNLERQKTTAGQLQDKYTAQGEIEKIYAGLEALKYRNLNEESFQLVSPDGENQKLNIAVQGNVMSIESQAGRIRITCSIELSGVTLDNDGCPENECKITGTLKDLRYTSYEISTVEASDEEDTE